MRFQLNRILAQLERQRQFLWRRRRILTVCAAVVVFWTTYAMILPAITWEKTLICQLEEHTHSEACFTLDEAGASVLTCPLGEHVHEASCFDAPPAPPEEFFCGKEAHTHTEDCFFYDGSLKCTMEAHIHSEDCLTPPEEISQEEIQEAPVLLCGMQEHTHSEDCIAEDGSTVCGLEEHIHTDACLTASEETESAEEIAETTEEAEEAPPSDALTISLPAQLALTEEPEKQFELPPMITADKQANEWQVVSGRYRSHESSYDNTQAQIIVDDDGNVLRLRKNIVPAGVENEFYVYLSVEPVFYHNWEEIFKGSGMVLNSANDTRDYSEINKGFSNEDGIQAYIDLIGSYGYSAQGHSTMLVADEAPFTTNHRVNQKYTTQTDKDQQIVAVLLERYDGDPNPIRINQGLVFSSSQKSTDSFTIVYCAPNSNHLVKLSNIHWDQKNKTLTFPHEAYDSLIETNTEVFDHILQRTLPQQVTDPMADYIAFLNVEYSSTGNTYSFDPASNTLTWDLSSVSVEPSQNPEDYEQISTDDAFSRNGAFQLVYKIRLKVTDPGFNSAAPNLESRKDATAYPTNKDTTVTYRTDKMADGTSDRTAHFRVPEVRGVLYDIPFRKVDPSGKPVAGAVFTLKDADGNVVDTITTEGAKPDPKDSSKILYPTYSFQNLPWGTYFLEETAPSMYSASDTAMVSHQTWEIPLCYTTDPAAVTPDTTDSVIGNMFFNGDGELPFEGGFLKIINYKFSREIQLRKVDSIENPLSGARFRLYTDAALTKEYDAAFEPSDSEGYFTPTGFCLDNGTYYLLETAAPPGYLRASKAGVLTVTDDQVTLFWNGKTLTADIFGPVSQTVYSLKLVNERAVPLPETGGTGYLPLAASGIAVLVLSWSYYFVQRRKKAGEESSD